MAETVSPIYISPFLRPYLEDSYASTACDRISTNKERVEGILSPIEGWVMTVQSLLVWENPRNSLTLFIFLNILFWVITSYNFLVVLCWGVLSVYLLYIWKTEIWPVVRVPAKTKDQDEWIPVHENLLSVPELSHYLAEYYVTVLVYIEALQSLRKKRKMSFVVLAYLLIFPIFLLSYLVPDSILFYIVGREAEADSMGDLAETDSDEESPAIDPARSAAIARTITDSEDESLAAHSDSSNGDNGLAAGNISASMTASFAPEVSQMPDFEGVCDEANSLMPDEDVMPSIDSIDTSRLPNEFLEPAEAGTDSDVDSLPPDSPRMSIVTNLLSTPFMERFGERLAAMVQPSDGASNIEREAQGQSHPLLMDPRDRIGDASLEGGDNSSDELEFEVIDRSELDIGGDAQH